MDGGSFYRAVWRWHFFAGLVVLPVLVWLATTGALYLYKPEIERAVYGGWTQRAYDGAPMPLGDMAASAGWQVEGRVTRIEKPIDPQSSWRMTVVGGDGGRRTAFIDPVSGIVLGQMADGGVMATVKNLHSLAITGPVGNMLVEIVAGWTIILCLTGFYLWWPRDTNKAVALRGGPAQRLFWRDFHATTGAFVGAIILFLALTGMPWSGYWGDWLRNGVNVSGIGRPATPLTATPAAHEDHAGHDDPALPWTMRHAGHPVGHGGGDIGPDRAIAIAVEQGIGAGWTLTLPATPKAPYLVAAAAVKADDARLLYIDAATGAVLQDAPYARFGAGAQAIEWGIAAHQGQQYGEPNRLVMLAGCVGVWLLALSAPILWWKRRKGGRLQPPPRGVDPGQVKRLAWIMLGAGALFPLTGATMLAALAGEWLWGWMFARG